MFPKDCFSCLSTDRFFSMVTGVVFAAVTVTPWHNCAASSHAMLPDVAMITAETLVDVSLEQVNIPLDQPDAIDQLRFWLADGQVPSQATIYCSDQKNASHHVQRAICQKVQDILHHHHVQLTNTPARDANPSVVLHFNRVISRDCSDEQRLGAFGCAVSVNMIHMVSSKKQWVEPAALPYHHAADLLLTEDASLD